MSRPTAILLLLLSALGCRPAPPLPAAPPPAPAAPVLASLAPADLDAFVAATVAAQRAIGFTVGVMQNGAVIFAKGYGLANLAAKSPVTTETLFAIGSVTKQFTCAVALQLEQEGKLVARRPVAKYDPALTRARDITLRDLAGMVSGYRDYYPLDFVDRPMARPRPAPTSSRSSPSRPLDFEPRTRWSYSNTGYLLLGAHRRDAPGGSPSDAALERRLLKPLGLTHTRYDPARGEPGLAEGYTPLGLGPARAGHARRARAGSAPPVRSGRRRPTCSRWDLALMDGKVLSPASFAHDEHAAPAQRRPHQRLRLRPVDPRSRTGARPPAFRRRGRLRRPQCDGAVLPFGRRRDRQRRLGGRSHRSDRGRGAGQADAGGRRPTVAGPAAREVALTLLGQIRKGDVDRSLLSEEYSAFLSPARLSGMAKSLQDAGEITESRPGVLVERGGMEVSTLLFTAGTTTASALMYRTPDGKVQQFLFSRR